TIVAAVHDLEMLIAHAQRLVIMHDGKVVRDGLPGDLLDELETFGIRKPCCYHKRAMVDQ
ncbi:MAG: hypothetical protein KKH68_05235, partial [Proteobacteria bacterium]|nr:hypothetical protein [Pseudomonadota bacterium]